MFYLYGIAKRRPKLSVAVSGIGGAPVQLLPWRGIAVAASPIETWNVAVNESNVRRHEHVIEAVMAETTVLPLRFGSVIGDADAYRRQLSQGYRLLTQRLALLAGRVEFGIRVVGGAIREPSRHVEPPPHAPMGPGTAYLRSLARPCSDWPDSLDISVHRALDPWAVTSVLWPQDTPSSELRASFLVERRGIEAFRQEVAGLQVNRQDLRVSCTGPWPPYSFVDVPFSRLDA